MEPIHHFKIIAFVVVAAMGLMAGLYPLRNGKLSARMLSLGNAAAAGVFLGAGLIHLLGDAVERWGGVLGIDYPIAYLVAGIGFLAVLALEKVALSGKEAAGVADAARGDEASPYLLAVVLSIHSIIAGISLGVEGAGAASSALLFAILAHKGSAAFALGNSLAGAGVLSSKAIKIVTIFAFSTPLGILLGAGLDHILESRAEHVFEAVFDSLAAGTFIYVCTMDVLAETFEEEGSRSLKVILATAGFGLMAVVALWT